MEQSRGNWPTTAVQLTVPSKVPKKVLAFGPNFATFPVQSGSIVVVREASVTAAPLDEIVLQPVSAPLAGGGVTPIDRPDLRRLAIAGAEKVVQSWLVTGSNPENSEEYSSDNETEGGDVPKTLKGSRVTAPFMSENGPIIIDGQVVHLSPEYPPVRFQLRTVEPSSGIPCHLLAVDRLPQIRIDASPVTVQTLEPCNQTKVPSTPFREQLNEVVSSVARSRMVCQIGGAIVVGSRGFGKSSFLSAITDRLAHPLAPQSITNEASSEQPVFSKVLSCRAFFGEKPSNISAEFNRIIRECWANRPAGIRHTHYRPTHLQHPRT